MNRALKELIEKALTTFNDPGNVSYRHFIGRSKWCKCLMMEATYIMHEKERVMDEHKLIGRSLLERMAEVFLNKKLVEHNISIQQEQLVELFEKIPMKIERSTLQNE